MSEIIKYIVQTYNAGFNNWDDEEFFSSSEAAKTKTKNYKNFRHVRVVKRTMKEEEVFVKENKPPKPKFKAGDLVRPEHVSKKVHPTLVGKIIGVIEDSYWIDGHRWNYNLVWNDTSFPDWNGCREYELVRSSLPFEPVK